MLLKMKPLIVMGMIFFALFLVACDDDDDEISQLNSLHEGWGNPGCWANECHTSEDTHNDDLQPYECVTCHGKNGAPDGHSGSSPCGDCHPNTHGKNGFPDPKSCNTCH